MRKALHHKKLMLTCFFDISKAFDSVWHGKLLQRMKEKGVTPGLYSFVKSFLTGRTMQVRYKGALSTEGKVDMGVPQGSVVAPLLFSFMIADVGNNLQRGTTITTYADDIAIWKTSGSRWRKQSSHRKCRLTVQSFQADINKIVNALQNLGFNLAPEKTVYMPVVRGSLSQQTSQWLTITVNGVAVAPVKSAKYLGVTFQQNGQWTQQVKSAITNARRALGLIKAAKCESWGHHRKILVTLTISLVRSRLLYGAQTLHGLPWTSIKNMAAVECKALRLALGLPQCTPQKQTYNEAGVLPLWHRMRRDACSYLFKSAQVFNSTEEEMGEEWNPALKTAKHHGLPASVGGLTKEAGIPLASRQEIYRRTAGPDPPWDPPNLITYDHLPGLSKQDNPHHLLATSRALIAEQYSSHYRIYTDGSVLPDERTGAGVFIEPLKWAIPVKVSSTNILSAELAAILTALTFLARQRPRPPEQAVIFTDSRTSLQALREGTCPSRPDLLQNITSTAKALKAKGCEVTYQRVPSHVGLWGNERADAAAKKLSLIHI